MHKQIVVISKDDAQLSEWLQRYAMNIEQLPIKGQHGACTIGMPWTTGGPGQPLHVLGKGCPQLAATAPMGQDIHYAETPKTPRGKFWIDSNQKKNVTFLLMVQRKKVQTSYAKVVSLGEVW